MPTPDSLPETHITPLGGSVTHPPRLALHLTDEGDLPEVFTAATRTDLHVFIARESWLEDEDAALEAVAEHIVAQLRAGHLRHLQIAS